MARSTKRGCDVVMPKPCNPPATRGSSGVWPALTGYLFYFYFFEPDARADPTRDRNRVSWFSQPLSGWLTGAPVWKRCNRSGKFAVIQKVSFFFFFFFHFISFLFWVLNF
jgi:hypothetical protein